MRLNCLPAVLLALSCSAFADHDCIEELPRGATIKRQHHLPAAWFSVGGKSLVDPSLHTSLKDRYSSQYISGSDEGPYGYLCLADKKGNVSVSTNGWGVGIDYSRTLHKCEKCNTVPKVGKEFRSGTNLRLGLTKAEVANVIGEPVSSNIVSVTFEETVTEPHGKVWHKEVLRLEFENELLIRFSLNDYREDA